MEPPAGRQGQYTYVIGEGDLRHIKFKLPSRLWMTRDRFVRALYLQNPSLRTYTDEDGIVQNANIIVTNGLDPLKKEDEKKEPFVMVTSEVHVLTVMKIVDKRGEVLIGNSNVRVTGAGIDGLIAKKDQDEANAIIDNDI